MKVNMSATCLAVEQTKANYEDRVATSLAIVHKALDLHLCSGVWMIE